MVQQNISLEGVQKVSVAAVVMLTSAAVQPGRRAGARASAQEDPLYMCVKNEGANELILGLIVTGLAISFPYFLSRFKNKSRKVGRERFSLCSRVPSHHSLLSVHPLHHGG